MQVWTTHANKIKKDIIMTIYTGNNSANSINGGTGNDSIIGNAGNDTIRGLEGNDTLFGNLDNDWLYGGWGFDELWGGLGKDWLEGGQGNDKLWGGQDNDTLWGQEGDDILYGSSAEYSSSDGNDKMYGEEGNDYLDGQQGDDTLDGGLGNDTLLGGLGNDKLYGMDDDDSLEGGDGDDTLDGNIGNDTLKGEYGNDFLSGGDGDDKLIGNENRDTLYGGVGQDELWGGKGEDYLAGESGNDTLYGGQDNDTMYGGQGDDILFGQEGNDSLYGGSGKDIIYGDSGNNQITGGLESDQLYSGLGEDTFIFNSFSESNKYQTDKIYDFKLGVDKIDISNLELEKYEGVITIKLEYDGQNTIVRDVHSDFEVWIMNKNLTETMSEDDFIGNITFNTDNIDRDSTTVNKTIYGDSGDNKLNGQGGNDYIVAYEGNDILLGHDGDDTLFGNQDGDVLFGGVGQDELWGGKGEDFLTGESGNDTLYGGQDNDTLYGEDGDDVLYGSSWVYSNSDGDDSMWGGNGNDTLFGQKGDDHIEGGDGQDVLIGGDGSDSLYGGNGYDRYKFENRSQSTHEHHDKIFDFKLGINKLDFSDLGPMRLDVTFDGNNTIIKESTSNFEVWLMDVDLSNTLSENDVFGNVTLTNNTGNDYSESGLYFDKDTIEIEGENSEIITKNIINFNKNETKISEFNFSYKGEGDDKVLVVSRKNDPNLKEEFKASEANDLIFDGLYAGEEEQSNADKYGTNYVQWKSVNSHKEWQEGSANDDSQTVKDTLSDGLDTPLQIQGVLIGHGGNGTLAGNIGNDDFVYFKFDGNDTITDVRGGNDSLQLGQHIKREHIKFEISDMDLKINFSFDSVATGSILFKSFLELGEKAGDNKIERIHYFNDDTWDDFNQFTQLEYSDGDDHIVAKVGTDNSHDVKKGTDIIYDQGGNDTYHYNQGDESLSIIDNYGNDTILFGENVNIASLIFGIIPLRTSQSLYLVI